MFTPVPLFYKFTVGGADFDGTNDYMQRTSDLAGNADSKQFTLSVWLRIDGGNNNARFGMVNGTDPLNTNFEAFFISAANRIGIFGTTAGHSTVLDIASSVYLAGPTWRHVLVSVDLTDTAKRHLYVNDVSDLAQVNTYINDTIDFTFAPWTIGASGDGTFKFNGAMAELWFQPGLYIDFSVEANRRKFRSAAGKPVNLNADGSQPTGTAPLVYLHLAKGEAAANFATNRGTGGNFTITGTLDIASTSPSD